MLRAIPVLLLFTSFAAAGDAKNSLTPAEIGEGWILLFDGETTYGWKTEGDVKAADGWLRIGGDKPAKATFGIPFKDFEIRLDYSDINEGKSNLVIFSRSMSQAVPATKPGRFSLTKIGDTQRAGRYGVDGDIATVFTSSGKTLIPMEIVVPEGRRIAVRNVRLKPLAMKPLFNGKNLDGWHEHPMKKASKWTVEDSLLRVRNGPGDLQTDAQWADFVVQAEVKTHGPALNSGIFFRCIPGDYQNGYEAQIQNGFKDGDRTKPADFGTGAIYRRIPARKVVSNDHEWFTLTIAAYGPNIATWVNGYQTVSWTDDRPADNNARKGTKTGKGAISLQGHDPTTDISFRNIRLVELSAAK